METSDIQCWEVCVGEESQREARGSGELFALHPPLPSPTTKINPIPQGRGKLETKLNL